MHNTKLAIIGLGYVGLPLCVEFARKYPTTGFDISQRRVNELTHGIDRTCEVDEDDLKAVCKTRDLRFSTLSDDIADCNVYIVTVPTPVDRDHRPCLIALLGASKTVGKVLKKGDIVIYESTVYPGATEEDCVPVLEHVSGLKFNEDFFCAYSPERVNPGDNTRTVTQIKKVTSGSTPEIAKRVDELYASIITAGTHLAPSIRVAEAAKVIENAQRDVNIAFVNELSMIFNRMGIRTKDVLEAAATKWNFLPFKPGLVGGHCIGVDPYYLTKKALEVGYNPEIILASRRLNENMGIYVANQVIKLLIAKEKKIKGSRVLVLGITFKENCPDIRNSRVVDVIGELKEFGCLVDVFDPWADAREVREEYDIEMLPSQEVTEFCDYDGIVLAVAHREFLDLPFRPKLTQVIYDIKSVLNDSDGSL
ncbi:nucleotide sugar dehydrogenase [Desulfosediminicola sp.]|uniref:nucleotide sugar dehydrogenase n=1 Tax=Desulfosediminicola sp. TaxID=2886825 RepID=UPI003AF21932